MRAARRVARSFLQTYLTAPGTNRTHVPATLHRLSTPALWRGLRLADPTSFPTGSLGSLHLHRAGTFQAEFSAKVHAGTALAVTVVAWDRGWRVADVRPQGSP